MMIFACDSMNLAQGTGRNSFLLKVLPSFVSWNNKVVRLRIF